VIADIEIGDNLLVLGLALIPAIPATIAAIVSIRQNRELKPNGGSSMNDKITALHRTVVATDRIDDGAGSTVTIDKTAHALPPPPPA
jgi:hypothetical protein